MRRHGPGSRARPTTAGTLLLTLALGALSAGSVSAYSEEEALGTSRAAVGRTLSDHVLLDRAERPVHLSSLRDRPLVVSLVYTSCYGSCTFLTRRLALAVDVARDALGADSFRVVTVGFDAANDTAERMAAYARKQDIGDDDWLVLHADESTVHALASELGFTFTPSPRGFDHVSQVSILDATGRVYRQVYSDAFPTPQLVEPLKELVWGTAARASTVDGWLSGLKLLCTVYDPAADRYRFDYSIFVGAFVGVLCLVGIAVFVIRSWPTQGGRHAG